MTTIVKTLQPIDDLRNNLTRLESEFAKALPAHIAPNKFTRVVMTAVQNNPAILKCDRRSLYNACMKAAADGLLPDGRDGAIVPFGDKATWMPMIGGLIKRLHQSEKIKAVDAQVVYSGDLYESWIDETGPRFKFSRERGESRGEPILTFAYAILVNGGFFFEEIDEQQMAAIEAVSRVKSGPWKGPFKDEMRRKSAIRRLAKRLPFSTDLEETFHREDDEVSISPTVEEGIQPATKPSKLAQLIEEQEIQDVPHVDWDTPNSEIP